MNLDNTDGLGQEAGIGRPTLLERHECPSILHHMEALLIDPAFRDELIRLGEVVRIYTTCCQNQLLNAKRSCGKSTATHVSQCNKPVPQ